MVTHSRFHRKKIGRNLLVAYGATKQVAFATPEYDEKATPLEKLLRRFADIT
jgi:hypothetical protein